MHWLGLPPAGGVQLEPGSRRHCAEQPSLSIGVAVVALLVAVTKPSPHRGTQTGPALGRVALFERARGRATVAVLHVGSSQRLRLPASHCRRPRCEHTAAGRAQPHPSSSWQSGVQPSPPVRLLSSHCSPGSSAPLPHLVVLMTTPSTGVAARPRDRSRFRLRARPPGCSRSTRALFHAGAAGGEGRQTDTTKVSEAREPRNMRIS